MYKLESTSSANSIGPDKAAELLTFNTFEGQRPVSRRHVDRLTELIKTGKFVKASVAIAMNGTGEKVLMNGQHQLHAIQNSGKSVKATVDYYTVEEPSDMAKLFATFDVNRVRTAGHIMHAARPVMKNEALREIPVMFLGKMGSVYLSLRGNKPIFSSKAWRDVLPTERVEMIESHASEVLALYDFISANVADREIPVVGVLCAMTMTMRANRAKFSDFWTPVLSAANLDRGSAQYKLYHFLKKSGEGSQGGWDRQFRDCAACIMWWNSWITGEERSIVKVGVISEIPKVLGK